MDSITQVVLGAAVGAVVAGPHIGARKAVLSGAVLGTLPDLDVFYPFDGDIDNFVLHRGATHSLIMLTLFSPLMGYLLSKLFRFPFAVATLFVWLVWVTHAMLDAMTVYGTQLLWPLNRYPFGTGSLFIIDPLYTLPLLAFFIVALFAKRWSSGLMRGAVTALAISTLYIGWSIAAQAWAKERALAWMDEAGLIADSVLATPLPFNTLFWRIIAVDGADYHNVYVPLLGDAQDIQGHRQLRVDEAGACAMQMAQSKRLEAFAGGFVRALDDGEHVVVSDLRMGITPNYVFSFAVAKANGEALPKPWQKASGERASESDWAWLRAGILGDPGIRPSEEHALIDPSAAATNTLERMPISECK